MQQGIVIEKAREIVKLVKDSKKKAQASIQGDLVRISSKDRDTLQETIALLKGHDSESICSLRTIARTRNCFTTETRSHREVQGLSIQFLVFSSPYFCVSVVKMWLDFRIERIDHH